MATTFTVGSLALVRQYSPAAVAGIIPASAPPGIYEIIGAGDGSTTVVVVDAYSGSNSSPYSIPRSAVKSTYASA